MARPAGSPMGPQVKAVLLSVLLCLAVLLTQQDQGSRSEKHIPYLNVRFDPWKMNLSWDCQENVTVVTCQMVHKEKGPVTKKPKGKACYCTFATYDLHRGATFVITVNDTSREPITETYANPGEEGTAAQNFSCAVLNASFMNCTWAKGPAAPEDVQYFLYIQDAKRSKGTQCPQYTERSGTHVGCHLQDLSELDFNSYFLVNGTSQQAGIQFFDTILSLNEIDILASTPTAAPLPGPPGTQTSSPLHVAACRSSSPSAKPPPPRDPGQLAVSARWADLLPPPWPPRKPRGSGVSWALVPERYSPPHNITVRCNQSHCLIQWEKPRLLQKHLSDGDFQFQLDIRTADNTQPSENPLVPAGSGTRYTFVSPQPRAKHTVRIRAANARGHTWGDWSQPVAFGAEEWETGPVLVYALVVLGTLVCALILAYLFKRFLRLHRLSPRIPHIKDVLSENHPANQQVTWAALALDAAKGDDDDVVTIQEVTESTATQ
ncbi:granulocyte-macrophage colony-stimulating factor receptor subunit alpha-like isoform 2-T5 [Hipposideros larvatus]